MPLLRSVTVGELVRRLEARVICCADRQELLVETLSIGAMNVNSAMEFFRKRRNMAVVPGLIARISSWLLWRPQPSV